MRMKVAKSESNKDGTEVKEVGFIAPQLRTAVFQLEG